MLNVPSFRSYQVRGHLAAQIDPLNLNNKTRQEAKKLVIRSVEVQDSDMDNVYQLPETTWIGGSVSALITYCCSSILWYIPRGFIGI